MNDMSNELILVDGDGGVGEDDTWEIWHGYSEVLVQGVTEDLGAALIKCKESLNKR
jgi:hypothetical protein